MQPLDALIKPALKSITTSTSPQQQDPEADLPKDNGIDNELRFVLAQPTDDPRIGTRLGRLRKDVCVDEVTHSVSVDSDSIGTK